MTRSALKLCVPQPGQHWSPRALDSVIPCLERQDAGERIRWALDYLPAPAIMTSSFGAQSAVMLHLMTRQFPDIPVVLIDTGYLFDETYEFIESLTRRLSLNLQVYRPAMSAAWQEVRHGRLWEQGAEGIQTYNQMNKVDPMSRALAELGPGSWFSGLRRSQSLSRRKLRVLGSHHDITKVHPLIDWSDRDVHRYLQKYDLPYHPLWEKGYVSIGDRHTSHPISAELGGDGDDPTRFFGLVRECGLHQPGRFRISE